MIEPVIELQALNPRLPEPLQANAEAPAGVGVQGNQTVDRCYAECLKCGNHVKRGHACPRCEGFVS